VVKNPNYNEIWKVKPLESGYSTGGSSYNKKEDGNRYNPGENDWKQLPQYAIWTTERYNHQPVYHHRGT
jgi:hypothetical protein